MIVWPDTFTNHFTSAIGRAAVDVLENAGYHVIVPTKPLCCGLTWISTGQLATAKRALRRTVSALSPWLREGTRVVGLEPSCTAVLRSDATELFPGDRDVQRLADQTVTLAELLRHTNGWRLPHIDAKVIAQTHCHQHAILGYDDDRNLLVDAGVELDVPDTGCCGLAGNFGFERGHYEVSMACAERVLFPTLRGRVDRHPRPGRRLQLSHPGRARYRPPARPPRGTARRRPAQRASTISPATTTNRRSTEPKQVIECGTSLSTIVQLDNAPMCSSSKLVRR